MMNESWGCQRLVNMLHSRIKMTISAILTTLEDLILFLSLYELWPSAYNNASLNNCRWEFRAVLRLSTAYNLLSS